MSKHTAGPWLREGRFVYALRDTFFDCCVQGPPNTPIEEKEANARLIAAAPDLLEALKDMVRYLDNNGKETDVSELARYAIRKAEGGDA